MGLLASSSVARGRAGGLEPPPIGLYSMQNRTFLVLLRPIFGEKLKTAPPKKIGCRSCEIDVVIRPDKAFEFPILAEISVSILRIYRPKSDKPCDSDSRTMKIRVKVVCSFLTLSKKPPSFSNPGNAPASVATFLVAVAAAPLLFFVTRDKQQRRCFLVKKAAALQRSILSK